jgi:murein L,D-transpeptidase YcbB/YkuD
MLAVAALPAMAQQLPPPRGPLLSEAQIASVRDVLLVAQQRLQQLGYRNSVTGRFDAGTRNAVEVFQADHGLRPTGNIDLETLAALGINADAGGASTAMLYPMPGEQTAMLPPTAEQQAELRFRNAPAYNFPIFTDAGDHHSTPQVRGQAGQLEVMGMPGPLYLDSAGRFPGEPMTEFTEDFIR